MNRLFVRILILFAQIILITGFHRVGRGVIYNYQEISGYSFRYLLLKASQTEKEKEASLTFPVNLIRSFVNNQNEISLGVGLSGIILLLLNRSFIWDPSGSSVQFDPLTVVSDVRSRADIIAAVACTGLLLNLFSDTSETNEINRQLIDNRMREREKVALVGYYLSKPFLNERIKITKQRNDTINWFYESIRDSIPVVTSVHVVDVEARQIVFAAGVIDANETKRYMTDQTFEFEKTHSILGSAVNSTAEVYLPDLQILPGKIEFSYLPINCQSVCIILLPKLQQMVVFGTNQAKALKYDDLLKLRTLSRLYDS